MRVDGTILHWFRVGEILQYHFLTCNSTGCMSSVCMEYYVINVIIAVALTSPECLISLFSYNMNTTILEPHPLALKSGQLLRIPDHQLVLQL